MIIKIFCLIPLRQCWGFFSPHIQLCSQRMYLSQRKTWRMGEFLLPFTHLITMENKSVQHRECHIFSRLHDRSSDRIVVVFFSPQPVQKCSPVVSSKGFWLFSNTIFFSLISGRQHCKTSINCTTKLDTIASLQQQSTLALDSCHFVKFA